MGNLAAYSVSFVAHDYYPIARQCRVVDVCAIKKCSVYWYVGHYSAKIGTEVCVEYIYTSQCPHSCLNYFG